MALQAAEAERLQYAAARNDLAFRVKEAYCELYYLERAIGITRSSARLLAYLEEVARAGYRGGTGRHAAVIKAQIERAGLEDRLRGLEEMRRPLAARFNAALSRRADAPVAIDSLLPAAPMGAAPTADADALAERLRAAHPELQALSARAAREGLAVELAGKEGYPDLTVGVDYIATGAARTAGMAPPPDSGKDPLVATASVSLPLWRGQYRARQREARARQRAVLLEREERENQLLAALELALYGLRDSERRIGLYRDALLPRAEQALGVAQQAYAAGQGSFLELIDAQRTLLEFRLARERAVADRAVRLAEIERLVGGPGRGEEGEP
jgi:outer membrane protein TolC